MEFSFENWKAGKFYMETCAKPVFIDENAPEIEVVYWGMLQEDVTKRIQKHQKLLFDREVLAFVIQEKITFHERLDCCDSAKMNELIENEIKDLEYMLFELNVHGLTTYEREAGINVFNLMNGTTEFPVNYISKVRNYISQKYRNPSPMLKPELFYSRIHAESITKKIANTWTLPDIFAESRYEFYVWLKDEFSTLNASGSCVSIENPYDNPLKAESGNDSNQPIPENNNNDEYNIFANNGRAIFFAYREEVILKDLSGKRAHYGRLFAYMKECKHIHEVVRENMFLDFLKKVEEGNFDRIEGWKQLASSKYRRRRIANVLKDKYVEIANRFSSNGTPNNGG